MSGKYGKSESYRAAQKDNYCQKCEQYTWIWNLYFQKVCNCMMTIVAKARLWQKMKDFRHI